ncbi:MAG: LysR family transcriptional regulator [Bacilli bacterium]|nr:LysR family transcriptional regulator [Bacilli bacterium]
MNINLDLYKVFYYVAKNESITRAANELAISQPAISKSIKTLEEQINTSLFIRKRDGVELTEAGETIFTKIKEAMELIDSAEEDMKSLTNLESGSINIGASKTIIHEFLMPYIKQFHKDYPNINIRIFTDKTSELIKKAKMGLIDIIFTNMPYNIPKDFESIKIMDLHDCFVANENFIYLKDKKITKNDLEKLPLLILTKGATTRIRLDDYCIENNITIHPKMEFGSNTLIKEFTIAGFGIGILTREHVKKELESNELFELDIEIPLKEKYLGMIVDSNRKNNIVTKKFIHLIKKT